MYNAINWRIYPIWPQPLHPGRGRGIPSVNRVQEKSGYLRSRHILEPTLLASPGASCRFQATPYPHPMQTTEPNGICAHSSRDVTGSGKCLFEERPTEEAEPRPSNHQLDLCELLFFSTRLHFPISLQNIILYIIKHLCLKG
jgi:hypothetical protein